MSGQNKEQNAFWMIDREKLDSNFSGYEFRYFLIDHDPALGGNPDDIYDREECVVTTGRLYLKWPPYNIDWAIDVADGCYDAPESIHSERGMEVLRQFVPEGQVWKNPQVACEFRSIYLGEVEEFEDEDDGTPYETLYDTSFYPLGAPIIGKGVAARRS